MYKHSHGQVRGAFVIRHIIYMLSIVYIMGVSLLCKRLSRCRRKKNKRNLAARGRNMAAEFFIDAKKIFVFLKINKYNLELY